MIPVMPRPVLPVLAALGALALAAARPAAQGPRSAPACAPDNAGLTLPAGFCATLFADGIAQPRHAVVAPTGELLVISNGAGVVLLRDADGDGIAEVRQPLAEGRGSGIALGNGHLYATWRDAIVRYRLAPGALQVVGGPDTVVRGLPMGGHVAHNFVLAGTTLYVNIGSRSNSCQVRERQPEAPGLDPCTELETRAGIWTFDATKLGQSPADGVRFATGIRNAVGLTIRGDGTLWAMQHGRDQLFQNWPTLFDEAYSAENPAEELLQVSRGDDFGWPYCYTTTAERVKVLAPEYGGDGRQVGRCAQKKAAVHTFPGHWAPNDLLFYAGDRFPAPWRSGVFVAFHGSWNRAPMPQAGYRVAFVPMDGNRPTGPHVTFADGFQAAPGGRIGRPTGLAQGTDGSLFVLDDAGGRVWRIAFRGR